MMVLVDTSVWIRFLRADAKVLAPLQRLLLDESVLGHELVEGELFIGDRGGRAALIADYRLMDRLPVVAHEEVMEFAKAHRLHGLGLSWVDVHLLAATIVAGAALWTADRALRDTADGLGCAHEP